MQSNLQKKLWTHYDAIFLIVAKTDGNMSFLFIGIDVP